MKYSGMKVLLSMALVLSCLAARSVQAGPDPAEQPSFILMMTPKRAAVVPSGVGDEKENILPRSAAMKSLLEQALAGKTLQPSERPPVDAALPITVPITRPMNAPMVIDLRKGLLRRGADDSAVTTPPPENIPAAAEAKLQSRPRFAIEAKDETLYRALLRWSVNGGHRLVWDAGVDFPARDATYPASELNQAIEMVMADTRRSGYPLHACWYANKVIQIFHVSQVCQRP